MGRKGFLSPSSTPLILLWGEPESVRAALKAPIPGPRRGTLCVWPQDFSQPWGAPFALLGVGSRSAPMSSLVFSIHLPLFIGAPVRPQWEGPQELCLCLIKRSPGGPSPGSLHTSSTVTVKQQTPAEALMSHLRNMPPSWQRSCESSESLLGLQGGFRFLTPPSICGPSGSPLGEWLDKVQMTAILLSPELL